MSRVQRRRGVWSAVALAAACAACPADRRGPRAVEDASAEAPQTLGLREFRDCSERPRMVELPPGRFLMGSAAGEEEAAGLLRYRPWFAAA